MTPIAALAMVLAATFPDPARASTELEEREAVTAETLSLFAREDFRSLDAMAQTYRETGSRTSSGLWHSTLFYAAFKSEIRDRLRISRDDAFVAFESRALRWATQAPDSPTAHILYGMVLAAEARADRSARNALRRQGASRELPRKTVTHARAYLEEHKSVAAVDPQWYEVMASVALDEEWEFFDFLALIDEALDREPLFYEIHFRAVDYFMATRNGGAAEIEAFARQVIDRTAGDEGNGLYARIYWYASQAGYGNALFQYSNVDWPLMRAGFMDVIENYPDAWNLNHFARYSCLARDRETTRRALERIEADFVPEAWRPSSLFAQCSFGLLLPP